ncbi:hypothetical protein OG225_30660 [Nocardia sp. NBC_01377]|uniref:hypothetical protein n=1 Tax=Nocardia sp. NBC_01377 TaxID=2903595 RepID=UPI0032524BE5
MASDWRIHTAQVAAQSDEDHIFVAGHTVVILDGATSHRSIAGPTGGEYAATLGAVLSAKIAGASEGSLVDILESSIAQTISNLQLPLRALDAPSCTVAVVRENRRHQIESLVLGDTTVVVGRGDRTIAVQTDTRLEDLGLSQSESYKSRLRSGSGYDNAHRQLLSELQLAQRDRRNRPGGYWIASTDPAAAHHSLTATYEADEVGWVIMATDGAIDGLEALGISWGESAAADSVELENLLRRASAWEATTDPAGSIRPRAKQHDDKTIAAIWLT